MPPSNSTSSRAVSLAGGTALFLRPPDGDRGGCGSGYALPVIHRGFG
jgi:hypothetical protein